MRPEQKIRRVRGFVLDMDGVLYRGRTPIEGSAAFLELLHKRRTPYILLTNNATLTMEQNSAKLDEMGIPVKPERIMTSAVATAMQLGSEASRGSTVYMIGEQGLRDALGKAGFRIVEEEVAEYVVVGYDRGLTYEKLAKAALAIQAGAKFIGTNPDKALPSERGLVPGTGATLAALEFVTGVSPRVIGKPERAIFDLTLAKLGLEATETAMVGDRLETDILGAQRIGLVTVLVLSGASGPAELEASEIVPDMVLESIATLADAWRDVADEDDAMGAAACS